MTLTRRQLLTVCGAALAAGVTGGWAHAAQTSLGRRHWMVRELTRELFEAQVGETFMVSHAPEMNVGLKLVKVVDPQTGFKKQHNAPDIETFALLFEGAPDQPLPQDTFHFVHPAIGDFDLFMVPVVARDPGTRKYEVIISRLLTK